MNYYKEKISQIHFMPRKPWNIDNKEEFGILLSAPSCYVRRWNLNYMEIDHADIDEITSLLNAAHITNKDSLMKDFENALSRGVGAHYEDFESFWKGSPCFDISELGQRGLNVFTCCKEFAEQFKNIVGNRGFCAWDYSEEISIIRMGFMMNWINYDEARKMLYTIVDMTDKKYHSWKEFAISYICGGAYYKYTDSGFDCSEAKKFFDVLCNIIQNLFEYQYGEY